MCDRRHALVVGGTGMLRDVTLDLVRQGFTVSVVARSGSRLADLSRAAADLPGRIHPMALDYRDTAALALSLSAAVAEHGPIETAVIWIHSTAPDAPLTVARAVGGAGRPCALFHVLGSAAADPSRPNPGRRAQFEALSNLRYHEVILGFQIGPFGSRWLTDVEISEGVLNAMRSGAVRSIVGVVEPWESRP
ncbi:MAG TPA: short-chain dehydrogenase [Symbiobacteriaceae bacterium]|jgi:NAD(P)-dependent dehydrogenase (short-subunit alcohol dehydrogenase family)|nr:short-chain dehydrogenase [Symbiobacteriaceae bacterium]